MHDKIEWHAYMQGLQITHYGIKKIDSKQNKIDVGRIWSYKYIKRDKQLL